MFNFFAIAKAVTLWSPVIIIVRIPASRQVLTDAATSFRGGSIMPTIPIKVKLFSKSAFASGKLSTILVANPSTRKASACIW